MSLFAFPRQAPNPVLSIGCVGEGRRIVDYSKIHELVVRKRAERLPDRKVRTDAGLKVLAVYRRRTSERKYPARSFSARMTPTKPRDDGNFRVSLYFTLLDAMAFSDLPRAREILRGWFTPRNDSRAVSAAPQSGRASPGFASETEAELGITAVDEFMGGPAGGRLSGDGEA